MEPITDTGTALLILQTVHTVVYAAGQASVAIILWCGLTGRPNQLLKYALICGGLIAVFRAFNGGICPLYTLARWLVHAQPGDVVQDMLTPVWFNEMVTPINVPPAVFGVLLVAWRSLVGRWHQPASPSSTMAADHERA